MKNTKAVATKTATKKEVAPVTTTTPVVKKTATEKLVVKNVVPVVTDAVTRVELGACTYHIWRNWCKTTLKDGGVITAKFAKDTASYNGLVSVAKNEQDKAKKILNEYAKKHGIELVAL